MDDRTLTAIQGSIAKWERVASGTYEERGGVDCPLCEAFAEQRDPEADPDDENAQCHGCPVKAATTQYGCGGTPYLDIWIPAARHTPPGLPTRYANTPEKRAAAQAELAFLRSLLPGDEQTNEQAA